MVGAVLYLRIGDDYVPVSSCTVEPGDGGVFVTEESRRRAGKTATWRRIATLPATARERIVEGAVSA